jgi:hypothetical protein
MHDFVNVDVFIAGYHFEQIYSFIFPKFTLQITEISGF